MAQTFADYQVLFDNSLTLDAAGAKRSEDFHWHIPDGFKHFDGSRKPILAFQVAALENSRLKATVNGHEVLSWNLTAGSTRGLWEAFNGSAAFPDNRVHPVEAPVEFTVLEGKVKLSQIVVWYQVEI